MPTKSLEGIEARLTRVEKIVKDSKNDFAIEQYKILFNVIVNLSDNVVKSVLTIFVIFSTIVAIVVQGIAKTPSIKDLLYINYVLITVFSYYLGYLRFRIRSMFNIVEDIERKEKLRYQGIVSYEKNTNWRFYTTKGLYWVVVIALIGINTYLILKL